MSFKITISRIERVEYIHKDWVKLFDYTKAEQDQIRQDNRPEQYGYKEIPAIKNEETTILIQEVEELDLKLVIKAINSIP